MEDEFQKQLNNNVAIHLQKLKTEPELSELKIFYRDNFEIIKSYIKRSNPKSAIEDLINLEPKIREYSRKDFLVYEINRGIGTGEILEEDLQ